MFSSSSAVPVLSDQWVLLWAPHSLESSSSSLGQLHSGEDQRGPSPLCVQLPNSLIIRDTIESLMKSKMQIHWIPWTCFTLLKSFRWTWQKSDAKWRVSFSSWWCSFDNRKKTSKSKTHNFKMFQLTPSTNTPLALLVQYPWRPRGPWRHSKLGHLNS